MDLETKIKFMCIDEICVVKDTYLIFLTTSIFQIIESETCINSRYLPIVQRQTIHKQYKYINDAVKVYKVRYFESENYDYSYNIVSCSSDLFRYCSLTPYYLNYTLKRNGHTLHERVETQYGKISVVEYLKNVTYYSPLLGQL